MISWLVTLLIMICLGIYVFLTCYAIYKDNYKGFFILISPLFISLVIVLTIIVHFLITSVL